MSAKREEKGPVLLPMGMREGQSRQGRGCWPLCSGWCMHTDCRHFWTWHMCSPVSMSSCCPLSTRMQGPHWPTLSSRACQCFCGKSRGLGGGCRSPSPMGIILPHVRAISVSPVKGLCCNPDGLHLMQITRVNLCHSAF